MNRCAYAFALLPFFRAHPDVFRAAHLLEIYQLAFREIEHHHERESLAMIGPHLELAALYGACDRLEEAIGHARTAFWSSQLLATSKWNCARRLDAFVTFSLTVARLGGSKNDTTLLSAMTSTTAWLTKIAPRSLAGTQYVERFQLATAKLKEHFQQNEQIAQNEGKFPRAELSSTLAPVEQPSQPEPPAELFQEPRSAAGEKLVVRAAESKEKCLLCSSPCEKRCVCGRCLRVAYCSKACQVAHWKAHKPSCFVMSVSSAATASLVTLSSSSSCSVMASPSLVPRS